MKLSGWGRFPIVECHIKTPRNEAELSFLVNGGPLIARGNGRSYGDSSLNPQMTASMKRFNKILEFDDKQGVLTVEAGVILADVISAFLPRGWFPPVTPGTKYVSIGGMIAADVHGKNHHSSGSFGHHVYWIDIMTAEGRVVRCDAVQNSELFHNTIGGMGLTGIIVRAAFKLIRVESAWIRQDIFAAANLEMLMDYFEATKDWTYSVAWLDCLSKGKNLGRSLLYCGEHAKLHELDEVKQNIPLKIPSRRITTFPVDAPSWAVNDYSVKMLNEIYYRKGCLAPKSQLIDWDTYFYPLDSILHWNRMYGKRGFLQFQCVIPLEASRQGIRVLLKEISNTGQGAFLAVLKLLGEQNSAFSFPVKGYTLALDFPITPKSLMLLKRLDKITVDYGGHFYLAKDSRMTREVFENSEPRARAFRDFRTKTGIINKFRSAQSQRLGL